MEYSNGNTMTRKEYIKLQKEVEAIEIEGYKIYSEYGKIRKMYHNKDNEKMEAEFAKLDARKLELNNRSVEIRKLIKH